MIGTGTIANVAAIVLGGAIGLGVRGGLKAHYQEGLMKAMGLGTLFIGAAGAMAGALSVQGGKLASLDTAATLSMILALALGTLVGEFFDFDRQMERLGIWLKAKADRKGDSQFVQGFVTASLVVCVGAMAIVGSIQDGLTGNATTLYTKAVIDGIVVMVMASVYGKGVLFAALAALASFGIGCGTQINAIAEVIENNIPVGIPPIAIGVVGGLLTGVVIIGVLLALWQRIKQIRGGEEDAASKY